MKPLLVLVTGPPGSGKTTLSRALGDAVGLPVVNRDTIKEGWWRTTGRVVTAGSPEATRAFELFFETVTFLLENDVSVIAEAAFARRFGPQELLDLGAGARTKPAIDQATATATSSIASGAREDLTAASS